MDATKTITENQASGISKVAEGVETKAKQTTRGGASGVSNNTGDVDAATQQPSRRISRQEIDLILALAEMQANEGARRIPQSESVGEAGKIELEPLRAHFAKIFELIDFIRAFVQQPHFPDTKIDLFPIHDGPNPFYNQIAANGGVALEMHGGMPGTLYTPLGELALSNGSYSFGNSTGVIELLKEKLGLVELSAQRNVDGALGGEYGPIYKITKDPGGASLPDPVCLPRSQYMAYEKATALWKKIRPEGYGD